MKPSNHYRDRDTYSQNSVPPLPSQQSHQHHHHHHHLSPPPMLSQSPAISQQSGSGTAHNQHHHSPGNNSSNNQMSSSSTAPHHHHHHHHLVGSTSNRPITSSAVHHHQHSTAPAGVSSYSQVPHQQHQHQQHQHQQQSEYPPYGSNNIYVGNASSGYGHSPYGPPTLHNSSQGSGVPSPASLHQHQPSPYQSQVPSSRASGWTSSVAVAGQGGPNTGAPKVGGAGSLISAERDVYMLSLPSQDRPEYYDDPSSGSGSDNDVGSGGGLSSYMPFTTNRGHKLQSSARHIRRGRLGSYPHTDNFSGVGLTVFSNGNHPNHGQDGIGAGAGTFGTTPSSYYSNKHSRKILDGTVGDAEGFAIAPNFHLLNKRRRKSVSPSSGDTGVALAFLPPAPQSPLDLLLSSSLQYTLGPKNDTFKMLGMSATGLIEQEGELVGSLRKVCDGLRGEGWELKWLDDEDGQNTALANSKTQNEQKGDGLQVGPEQGEKQNSSVGEEEEAAAAAAQQIAKDTEKAAEEESTAKKEKLVELEERAKKIAEEVEKEREDRMKQAKADETQAQPIAENATVSIEEASDEKQAKEGLEITSSRVLGSAPVEDSTESSKIVINDTHAESDVKVGEAKALDSEMSVDDAAGPSMDNEGPQSGIADSAVSTGADVLVNAATNQPIVLPSIDSRPSEPEIAADIDPDATMAETPGLEAESNDTTAIRPSLPPEASEPLSKFTAAAAEGVDLDAVMASAEEPATAATNGEQKSADNQENGVSADAEEATEIGDEEGGNREDEEEPTRRRSGRVAEKQADAARTRRESSSSGVDESDGAFASAKRRTASAAAPKRNNKKDSKILEEELPEYAKRLVDPEVFVRSLFVSKHTVEMPVSVQGGPPDSTATDLLSPNEQEVMVHDCLTDLHRFLADSLEYRSRLSEIRDGVLGVERRRKGMWKLVRMVAADWLEEESQAHEND